MIKVHFVFINAIISLLLIFGNGDKVYAGPLTEKCQSKTSQGPEGVISKINCLQDEYLRLSELQQKINSFLEYGRGIRGELSTTPHIIHQCRNHLGIMKTYKVPKKVSGGMCSDIKNQHRDAYNFLYREYCRGISSFNKELRAQDEKVQRLSKAYDFCFDQSVKDIIPATIRQGDRSDYTGHSAFNDREGFIQALNQLRTRWKANNYEEEIKSLARTCNDLLSYAERTYPKEIRDFSLHCR